MTKRQAARTRLVELINTLDEDAALPPERDLAVEWGMARGTLRAAIDDLVAEGQLERRARLGTFITRPSLSTRAELLSFAQDMAVRGMVASTQVVDVRTHSDIPRVAQKLLISPTEQVHTIRRLRLADGEPMAIETLHTPADILPDLTRDVLEREGFYAMLAAHGIQPVSGTQSVAVTVLNSDEAQRLNVVQHSPAFHFKRISKDQNGRVVEFVESLYRGDRYELEFDISPHAPHDA